MSLLGTSSASSLGDVCLWQTGTSVFVPFDADVIVLVAVMCGAGAHWAMKQWTVSHCLRAPVT